MCGSWAHYCFFQLIETNENMDWMQWGSILPREGFRTVARGGGMQWGIFTTSKMYYAELCFAV